MSPDPETNPNPPSIPSCTVEEVLTFFRSQGKAVLTLAGYSGAGYEHPGEMRQIVSRILDAEDPATTIINIGVTPDGIGEAYQWAKERGFTTSGIVSSVARDSGAAISSFCDHPFFIEDTVYGGFTEGHLSPTSEAMVAASDQIISIGGGAIACDELIEMERRGKPFQFIPADMNHRKATAKATSHGHMPPGPEELRGPAHARFGTK